VRALGPEECGKLLIRRAVTLAYRAHGWTVFYAYADPDAGEVGTIYQALGWSYTGAGRLPHGRRRDLFLRPDGRKVDERILRRHGVKLDDLVGWRRVSSAPKHRYVWIEGAANPPSLPQPKRRA
jgi:hypothetical protein